jgi:hypothetical protein
LEQVFQLAETIVIKSEDSAIFINNRVAYLYGDTAVNPVDKASWKYYLNLAGIYHPLDEKITITSLDTLHPIEFSAANLKIHTATAKAYQYGTRYYRELLTQHPEKEQFIIGTLQPVDVSVSTAAPDFSVLGYQTSLVDSNEESLINNINAWLQNYKTRWYNKQYNMSDNLYLANLLGVMCQQLVPLIITLRLRACKTSEAHSYHIREYLASNGMLDEYLDYMTRKQALFFYRNINYIERNAGRVETFTWLLEKVLTDRNIPVAEISLSQSDDNLLTSYKPTTRFSRQAINVSTAEDSGAIAFYTLSELLAKETNEAPSNTAYINQNFEAIEGQLSKSKSNKLKTKVLESRMIDYTDAGLYSIQDTTLDLWCHMSISGNYTAAINFVNKLTNKTIAIPNHVAFLYFLYAYCQVYGIAIQKVPELFVHRVAIDPLPSIETMAKVVDKNYVTDEDLEYIQSLHTPLETLISTTAFNDFVKRSFVSYKAEHMFAAIQNNIYKRALIKNATYRMYKAQREVSPYAGQNFLDIFKTFGLQITGMTVADWSGVYKDMYEKSTGMDLLLTETQSALQSTMIKLFKKLSSYSIQFLSEINKTTIRSVNWSAVRMGDIARYGKDLRRIRVPIIKILDMMSHSVDYRFIELKQLIQKFYITTKVDLDFIDPTIQAWISRPIVKYNLNINTIVPNLQNMDNCLFENPEQLPEFSPYYALTEEERRNVRDIYQNKVTDEDLIPSIDIDSMPFIPKEMANKYQRVSNKQINGFKHAFIPENFELRVEREFIDLDAYESNFGTLNSDAFKPFKGLHKNNLGFKLTPGPVESVINSFKYTGGILHNPGFGFSLNLENDKDIGGFNFIQPPSIQQGSFNVRYDKQILTLVYGSGNHGLELDNYSFVRSSTTLDAFKIFLDKQTIDTGVLNAGSTYLTFKIQSNGTARIKTDFVFNNLPSVGLEDLNLDTGSYILNNFTLSTGGLSLLFNYGTSVFLGTYSFDNFYSDVTFGSFIKDETQLGKMVYSAGKMEFNDLNWVYSLYQMGVFVMPVLTQELNSFNYYPPMEISYLVTNPLTYEIGDVTYDGSSHVTDIS